MLCSTSIAHQSRPSATSAIPPAPIGEALISLVTMTVSSAIPSAMGCASMVLIARGMATRSIQVEACAASTGAVVLFVGGAVDEFMPYLPSAYMMNW